MNQVENLHYAIGQLAFAVAFSDGKVQKEERIIFENIVNTELANHDLNFNVSDIIFKVLEKDKIDSYTIYDWAMKEINLNVYYLSPALKEKFISVMEKVAIAFPPVTKDENSIISRFKNDIAGLHGDPVYYNK